jgi:ribosome biogenesis GTPase A
MRRLRPVLRTASCTRSFAIKMRTSAVDQFVFGVDAARKVVPATADHQALTNNLFSAAPKFLIGAASAKQFPQISDDPHAGDVAFVGRSNVGKSSLLNALVGKTICRVSNTPGRT